jgi:hypothetical protein
MCLALKDLASHYQAHQIPRYTDSNIHLVELKIVAFCSLNGLKVVFNNTVCFWVVMGFKIQILGLLIW